MADLAARVEELWEHGIELEADDESARATVHEAIDLLDRGEVRVAEVVDGEVVVHEWLKQAILLLFGSSDGDHRARAVRVRRQDPAEAGLRGGRRAGRARAPAPGGARSSSGASS